jgi:Spy/CpxP family protein refolding chaperone
MNFSFGFLRHPYRLLIGAAVIAVAGGLTTLAVAQPFGGAHGAMHGGMHGGMDGGPMMMAGMIEHMLDNVDASEDQRTRIHAILKAAHQDLSAQRQAGAGLHQQAMQLFTSPTIDAAAAEALRVQIQGQMDVAGKRMWQAMIDASNVLTPEQRQKVAERAKKRHDRMERHMKEHGGASAPMH